MGTGSLDSTSKWTGVPSGGGSVDGGAGRDAGAGTVVDLDPRPAELLDAAVAPDPGAVVERAEPVGLLLDDQHDGEVVERDRHIQPPHALERRVGGPARRLGLADRPDAPGPVAAADPGRGIDSDLLAVDDERPIQVPSWANRCAFSVTRLPERRMCGCSWTTSNRPSQVRSAAMPSVSSRTMPQFAQRVDDLDPVAVDVLVSRSWSMASERCTAVCVSPRLMSKNASLTPRLG